MRKTMFFNLEQFPVMDGVIMLARVSSVSEYVGEGDPEPRDWPGRCPWLLLNID